MPTVFGSNTVLPNYGHTFTDEFSVGDGSGASYGFGTFSSTIFGISTLWAGGNPPSSLVVNVGPSVPTGRYLLVFRHFFDYAIPGEAAYHEGQDNLYRAYIAVPVGDGGGTGPTPPAQPPAPTSSGPPSNPCLGGTVPIQWTAVSGAATYSVLRNGIIIATGLTATAYTDNTAQVGVYYAYTVTATGAGGTSVPSQPFNVIPCAISTPPNPAPLPADGDTPWGAATPACDSSWAPATPGCDTIWGDSTATATDWAGGKSC